jgi:hypothetical protein
VTNSVAFLTLLAGSAVRGRNPTTIAQVAPGARVVFATNWPPVAGPQVDNRLTLV